MSSRVEKVNSLLQRQISEYLLENLPEGITGLLTIKEVDTTPDMKQSKVFFSVVGQDESIVLEILKRNVYDLQGSLYKTLEMRHVPKVFFVPDTSGEYAGRISKVISELHDDHE